MLNDNIKIVFLGGTKNHIRILVDAPKDVNIVRSTVLEKRFTPNILLEFIAVRLCFTIIDIIYSSLNFYANPFA